MHVDLDAFFAAVEEQKYPEYKGKPVVVGADPKEGRGRGVVSTCNYEARKFGIHSAMPISRAWILCKDAIFLPVNYRWYKNVSFKIMRILKSFADTFEQAGIDEAFLDVSKRVKDVKEAENLARKIKSEIVKNEQLTCSIGIGSNKLVAKIASDFRKPDGLTVVEEEYTKAFLAPLEVDKLWGIGRKTKSRLNTMGIRTIGDLASYNAAQLRKVFGAAGLEFHQMAQGIYYSKVVEERIPKSFSREHTFAEDTFDENLIHKIVDKLFNEAIKEVTKHNFIFRTLTVKVRYEDFETHTRSKTFSYPITKPDTIKEIPCKLLDPFLQSEKAIRLVGVKASNLIAKKRQTTLKE